MRSARREKFTTRRKFRVSARTTTKPNLCQDRRLWLPLRRSFCEPTRPNFSLERPKFRPKCPVSLQYSSNSILLLKILSSFSALIWGLVGSCFLSAQLPAAGGVSIFLPGIPPSGCILPTSPICPTTATTTTPRELRFTHGGRGLILTAWKS